MWEAEGKPHTHGSRHTATLAVLTCQASTLSTVPWVDRAVAWVFPGRLLDRGSPNGGGGADMEGGKRRMKRTGIALCGGCRPHPGVAQISEPPPVGRGRGSVQAVGGCPEVGMRGQVGQVVWGSSERAEGHGGHCLASAGLKRVQVKGQGAP